ncbi:TPA: hypothetical protein ACH3X2_000240 [Trebouxia sp. C0005]
MLWYGCVVALHSCQKYSLHNLIQTPCTSGRLCGSEVITIIKVKSILETIAAFIIKITTSLTLFLLHSTRHTSEKNQLTMTWVLHKFLHWKRGLLPFPALADLEPLVLLCRREFSSARSLSGKPPFSAAPDAATAPAPASPAGFRWLGCNTAQQFVSQQWAQPAFQLMQKTRFRLPDQSSDPSGLTSEVGRTCLSGLRWPLHQGFNQNRSTPAVSATCDNADRYLQLGWQTRAGLQPRLRLQQQCQSRA